MRKLLFGILTLVSAFACAADQPGRVVTVYYLHNTWRCLSCNSIESLTRAAVLGGKGENTKVKATVEVQSPFAELVKAGGLTFQAINVDPPENQHYLADFKARAKFPVIVETVDGKVVRTKLLDEVWDRLGDSAGLVKYVQDEVQAFLKAAE